MFVYKDYSVCLQSQSPRNACPQSLHSLPPGDSEFHRAARCGDDGQTHSGLTGGDLSPAGRRPTREKATEPRRLVHSIDQVRFWVLQLISLAASAAVILSRCVKTPQPFPERPAHLNSKPISDSLMSRRRYWPTTPGFTSRTIHRWCNLHRTL